MRGESVQGRGLSPWNYNIARLKQRNFRFPFSAILSCRASSRRIPQILDILGLRWSRSSFSLSTSTKAGPRLQAEGFGGCRIEFDYAAGLRRGGGLQAAVGRARLDRLTSAWRPNPRHRLNVAHLPSLGTSPIVPPLGTSGTFASPEGEGFNHPRWGH